MHHIRSNFDLTKGCVPNEGWCLPVLGERCKQVYSDVSRIGRSSIGVRQGTKVRKFGNTQPILTLNRTPLKAPVLGAKYCHGEMIKEKIIYLNRAFPHGEMKIRWSMKFMV